MFFIGIFGVEDKQKIIKSLGEVKCKNCNINNIKLIKSYRFFHFFFLPLFRWNERYYAICESCGMIYDIPKEKGLAVEREENIDITYWDLRANEDISYEVYNICESCRNKVNNSYQYCPHCGHKMR